MLTFFPRYTHGLRAPFRGMGLLRQHPKLWAWVLPPALVNTLITLLALVGIVVFSWMLIEWVWPMYGDTFWQWVYKITVNQCYDYLRKRKVRKLVYESDMGDQDERTLESSPLAVESSAAVDDRLEDRDYLMKLLSKVSEEERMLLIQKEVEGLTVQELAELTGINENTIKVKLFRARKKLVQAAAKLDRAVA